MSVMMTESQRDVVFTPFMLRILAIAALFGLAAQARYGVHERLMYWLTYRQINHDHSVLVRFVDLNEPWMSWTAGVLYALVALVMLVLFVRVVMLLPVVLEIALSGIWAGVHWCLDVIGAMTKAVLLAPWRALDRAIRPAIRVTLRKRIPEVLEPLPAGSVRPRHATTYHEDQRAS